jgi:hypothetical protein
VFDVQDKPVVVLRGMLVELCADRFKHVI